MKSQKDFSAREAALVGTLQVVKRCYLQTHPLRLLLRLDLCQSVTFKTRVWHNFIASFVPMLIEQHLILNELPGSSAQQMHAAYAGLDDGVPAPTSPFSANRQ
jgi:hypothetical protein